MTAARPAVPPRPHPFPPSQPPHQVIGPPSWTLADVSSGRRDEAYRLVVAGIEGIGKTTFAAGAPKPIFLPTEDGSDQLNVSRFPRATSWLDAHHAIELLMKENHDYQTLIVDTLDGLEPMLWDFICRRDGKKNRAGVYEIEAYGYGKGFNTAVDTWRGWLNKLEQLRRKKINVVLLAHTHIKTFKNPDGADYDRYQLQLNDKAAGTIKQWCDAQLFANFETYSVKAEETDKKGKGISTGARYLYTERTAAYDAKNRYGLPTQLALSWDEFEAAVKAGRPDDPALLLQQINRQLERIAPEQQEKCRAAIERAGTDALKLTQLLNYANNQPTVDLTVKEE